MRRLLFLFLPFIQVVEDTEVFFYQVRHILKVKAQKLEQLPAVIMAPEGCVGAARRDHVIYTRRDMACILFRLAN